ERGVATRAAARGDLCFEVANPLPCGQHGDDADDNHHEGAESVDPQNPIETHHGPAAHDVDGQHDAGHEHPRGCGRAEPTETAPPRRHTTHESANQRQQKDGDQHQSCSSVSWSKSSEPRRERSWVTSTRNTITANKTSSDAPTSTRRGNPAVARNATRATPLSTSRMPTIWETALRRVTSAKNPTRTADSPMGMSRPAVVGTREVTERVEANARKVSAPAATSDAGTLTRG